MNKKITKMVSLSAASLALLSVSPSLVSAAEWHANTPNQIGKMNQDGTYTVKNGDTVWAIGVHFNIKPNVIEEVNHISNPRLLQIGTILKLHVNQKEDKATIEAVTPNGEKHEKVLTQKDKIVKNQKFGVNVASEVNKEAKASKPIISNQASTREQQNLASKENSNENNNKANDEQIAMATYYTWFTSKGNTVASPHLYFVKDGANSYAIGQGTSDSTIGVTIKGDKVEFNGGGNGTTPSQKGEYTVKEVLNKFFSTQQQKNMIDNAIKNSTTN